MDDFKMRPGHSQLFWIFKKDAQIIAEYAQTKIDIRHRWFETWNFIHTIDKAILGFWDSSRNI